jgi:hypothetical protein
LIKTIFLFFQTTQEVISMKISLRSRASAGLAAIMAITSMSTTAQPASAQILVSQFVYSYAVKFVCGYQPPLAPTAAGTTQFSEPPVKNGNYATEINIFNPQFKDQPLRKRFIVLSRNGQSIKEPESVSHVMTMTMNLKSGYATMDDCDLLWKLTKVTPPPPPANSLLIGYLVINSRQELDVDAVYTSAGVGVVTGQPPTVSESRNVSIDVERIPGKRVQLNISHFDNPAGALP